MKYRVLYKRTETAYPEFGTLNDAMDAIKKNAMDAFGSLELLKDDWTSPRGIERISAIGKFDENNNLIEIFNIETEK